MPVEASTRHDPDATVDVSYGAPRQRLSANFLTVRLCPSGEHVKVVPTSQTPDAGSTEHDGFGASNLLR